MSIHILESYPKHSKEIMDEYYTKDKYTFLDIAIGAIVLNGCFYLRVLCEISQRNYGYYYNKDNVHSYNKHYLMVDGHTYTFCLSCKCQHGPNSREHLI